MHPNPIFRDTETARSLQFARDRAFGVLAISTDTAPLLAHVPFLLDADGARADLHLVRSNPICRALGTGLGRRHGPGKIGKQGRPRFQNDDRFI